MAAFHEMCAPGGSYAEYAIAWNWTVFYLPDATSFEGNFSVTMPFSKSDIQETNPSQKRRRYP
jgi:hypothetical protein